MSTKIFGRGDGVRREMDANELAQGVRAILKKYGVTENSEATLAVVEYIQGEGKSFEPAPGEAIVPYTRVRFVGKYLASLVGGLGVYLGMHNHYHMIKWDWNQDGRITLNTEEEFEKIEWHTVTEVSNVQCPTCREHLGDYSDYDGHHGYAAEWWADKALMEHADERHT